MVKHGLTGCARVYRIPDGVKYIVVSESGDFRNGEMLQLLRGAAVQVVIDDGHEVMFIWPDSKPENQP